MKKCPYCAEEIQDDAVKCRFCGEFLDSATKPKEKEAWYYSDLILLVGALTVGPLVLPWVWTHPRYKTYVKILISLVLVIVTLWFIYMLGIYVDHLSDMWRQIDEISGRRR